MSTDVRNLKFTAEDAADLLAAIFGNRPIKFFEGRALTVAKYDVVLHRDRDNKLHIYNVEQAGSISSLTDNKLTKWVGYIPAGGDGANTSNVSKTSIVSFAKKLYNGGQ